jgi:hypothetical protein
MLGQKNPFFANHESVGLAACNNGPFIHRGKHRDKQTDIEHTYALRLIVLIYSRKHNLSSLVLSISEA